MIQRMQPANPACKQLNCCKTNRSRRALPAGSLAFVDADGVTHTLLDEIKESGGYSSAYFGKTVSMDTHLQVKKEVMVEGIFNDWQNWSKGNAILSRIPFSRLGDPEQPGKPRNIPLYQPPVYTGTRIQNRVLRSSPACRHRRILSLRPAPDHPVAERHPPLSRNKIEQSISCGTSRSDSYWNWCDGIFLETDHLHPDR